MIAQVPSAGSKHSLQAQRRNAVPVIEARKLTIETTEPMGGPGPSGGSIYSGGSVVRKPNITTKAGQTQSGGVYLIVKRGRARLHRLGRNCKTSVFCLFREAFPLLAPRLRNGVGSKPNMIRRSGPGAPTWGTVVNCVEQVCKAFHFGPVFNKSGRANQT